MIESSNYSVKSKFIIAVIFGIITLLMSPFGISSEIGNINIDIPWSLFLPIIISMAFGWRYGLICGISGAALFPLLLWSEDGYANIGTALTFIAVYVIIGISNDKSIASKFQFLQIRLALSIFLSVTLISLSHIFLFNPLLALNPAFWTNNTINELPKELLYTFAIKDSLNLVILALITETLLRIPIIRKLLKIPTIQVMADNTKIIIATMLTAVAVWIIFIGLDKLLFANEIVFNDHHVVLAFIVIITSGFFASRMLFKYSETHFENQSSLSKSEALYRLLTDNSTDIIARHDTLGNFTYISPACNALLGYHQEDLIGHHPIQFTHPDDFSSVTALLTRTLAQYHYASSEFRFRCKNGNYIWLESNSHFIVDPISQDVIEMHSSSRDITNRKKVEMQVKESESKFKALYENANDAIFLLNDGLFFDCNPTTLKTFNCSLDEIIGKSPADFSPTLQPDGTTSVEKAKMLIEKANKGTAQNFEWKHTRADGTLFDAEVLLNSVIINQHPMLQAIVRDITERKLAEEAIKASEIRYKSITNGLTDYLYTVIIENNKAVETIHGEACFAITGYTAQELSTDSYLWFKMIYDEDKESVKSKFQAILDGNSVEPFEHRIFCKDGTIKWLCDTIIPKLDASGKLISYDGVIKDITERKEAERLRFEVLERLNKIASNVPGMLYQYRLRPDGRSYFPFTSKAINKIYRVTPEDVKEDASVVFETIHPDDFNMVVASIQESARNLTPWQLEYRVKFQDETIQYLYGNALPEKEEDGSILWHGFITDITEKKKAEEQLKDNEAMFTDLAANVPGVIYQFYARNDGTMGFYYIDPKASEILGMSEDKSDSEWSIGALIHPDDRSDFFKTISSAISEVKEMHYEGRLSTTKGIVWIQILSKPMVKSNEIIFNGIILNITERKLAEEKIRENERVLLESQAVGHIGSYITNLKTGEWECTAELERIFGIYQNNNYPHNLKGWVGFIHPDSQEELFAYHQAVVEQRKRFDYQYQIIRINDGEHRWVQGTGELEYDSNNNPIRMLGVIQDITERKQAEDALKSLATNYANLSGKAFFEAVTNHIAQAMKLDYVFVGELTPNKESIKVLGGTAHDAPMGELQYDLMNTPCHNVVTNQSCFYPSGIQALFPNDELLIQMGIECYLGTPLLGKNNEPLGILVALHSKPVQNTDIIANYFNFFIDRLSAELQRLKTSEELRKSEEKLSSLFGSMAEMVLLHELVFNNNGEVIDYRITDCNNAYILTTGLKKEDIIGKLATELYQVDVPPYLEEYTNVALTGNSFEYNNYFSPLDKHFIVSVVSPSKNTFATITTDITSMRQIQEVITAKNQELENYLYVTSHDLRSPLVNIQGFSQRLQKQADAINKEIEKCPMAIEEKANIEKITHEGIPKTLDFIFTNVAKMDTLINGLLQISRTGRIKMTIKQIDANNLFQTIISALNFQLTELNATVKVDKLPECYGDETLLNQLFTNIISNAIKYRDKKRKLVIEISSTIQFKRVIYTIKDNGIGISSRHLEKIWDVFYRVDSSAPESGEGIGLSLVKRITDKHKGKVWVESEEGVGTSFFVGLQRNDFSE